MTQPIIHICSPKVYKYNGIEFKFGYSTGPWPLKKDGDPKARAGRTFYTRIKPWVRMAEPQREIYRVGGGCQCL